MVNIILASCFCAWKQKTTVTFNAACNLQRKTTDVCKFEDLRLNQSEKCDVMDLMHQIHFGKIVFANNTFDPWNHICFWVLQSTGKPQHKIKRKLYIPQSFNQDFLRLMMIQEYSRFQTLHFPQMPPLRYKHLTTLTTKWQSYTHLNAHTEHHMSCRKLHENYWLIRGLMDIMINKLFVWFGNVMLHWLKMRVVAFGWETY